MERPLLNLAALRAGLGRRPRARLSLGQIADTDAPITLSRRQFLGVNVVGAAALSGLARPALDQVWRGPYEMAAAAGRVIFSVGGTPRWSIDPAVFDGSARVIAEQLESGTRVSLSGARFPGTAIPADFTCEITEGIVGSRMKLSLALGSAEFSVPFESWLAGGAQAETIARIEPVLCAMAPHVSLRLGGAARLVFAPDWSITAVGADLAGYTCPGVEARGDAVTIALADPASSMLAEPPAKATRVWLTRGAKPWQLEAALPAPEGARYEVADDAFSHLRVDIGSTGQGVVSAAVLEPGDAAGQLSLQPAGSLLGDGGEPFSLSLTDPRLAIASDGLRTETTLLAGIDERPTWMHSDDVSLQLGGGRHTPGLEAHSADGVLREFICEPGLHAVAAPMAGAVVEARPLVPQATVRLVADARLAQAPTRVPRSTTGPATRIEVKPEVGTGTALETVPVGTIRIPAEGGIVLAPLAAFAVDVIRRDDFLFLRFGFSNLTLQAGGGKPARLVKTEATKPAYITAQFPCQHIGEQAFVEGTGQPAPALPPIGARLSGPSRLVFKLPDAVNEIPYTLEALLSWSDYELAVAPTALPPPTLPQLVQAAGRDGVVAVSPRAVDGVGGKLGMRPEAIARPVTAIEAKRPQTAIVVSADPRFTAIKSTVGATLPVQALVVDLKLRPEIAEPTPLQTAIEAPYRLMLSPNRLAGWVHASAPVAHDGRIELWHTRLGVRSAKGSVYDSRYEYAEGQDGVLRTVAVHRSSYAHDYYRTLRAIWSPDYATPLPPAHDPPRPFLMSLHNNHRAQLVKLTADYSLKDALERTIQANRLMLTPLGAWLDVRYAEEIPPSSGGCSIEEWVHEATMGRDQYVRVVEKGYLFPFGHRASFVTVTERKFERSSVGIVAYLRQRYFIVVREPIKDFPALHQPNDGRAMPFERVQCTTLVTPDLNPPAQSKIAELNTTPSAGFWPRVGNDDFQFHFIGTDCDGQRCEFDAPIVFVGVQNMAGTTDPIAYNTAAMRIVVNHYNQTANRARRTADFSGQKLAVAESSPDKPGDTTLEINEVVFGAELAAPGVADANLETSNQTRSYPTMAWMQARIPAVAGIGAGDGGAVVLLDPTYVAKGWDGAANKGQVFVRLASSMAAGVVDEALKAADQAYSAAVEEAKRAAGEAVASVAAEALESAVDFAADKAGGLATPNMNITGLSRAFGPVGGAVSSLAKGEFDPKDFFAGAGAQILGGLNLSDIIPNSFGDGKNIPKLTAKPVYPGNDTLALPIAVDTSLYWSPDVIEFAIFKPASGCKFELNANLHTELAGGKSTYTINGIISKFAVDFFGFIIVHFARFEFRAASGQKTSVSPDISEVEFGGPLEFINELKDFLSFGEEGGLSIDLTPTKVVASFTLAIPEVAVGVLTIQNMSFTAALTIPFFGDPVRLRFAFCSRENPFILTVSMFGGGGFAAMEMGLDGMKLLEASLEFGGSLAFDIGVASGGIYVMAGIYFKWEETAEGGVTELTGYVRMGGSLSVLGIITISCEFYLGLTYSSAGNKVWGEAKLTVKIKLLFFSTSVSMSVRREFADPPRVTFKSLMPAKSIWDEYCDAFA